MKLSCKLAQIFSMVLGATTVLASASPAQGLIRWAANNLTFSNTNGGDGSISGTFDADGSLYGFSNINLKLTSTDLSGIAGTTQAGTYGSILINLFNGATDSSGVSSLYFSSSLNNQIQVRLDTSRISNFGYPFFIGAATTSFFSYPLDTTANPIFGYETLIPGGGTGFVAIQSISNQPVPFEIAGGATIPTLGSVLALGIMRKARKFTANKQPSNVSN